MNQGEQLSELHTLSSQAVCLIPRKRPRHPVEDDNEEYHLRKALYEEAWGKCRRKIKEILTSIHRTSLDQISQFVKDSKQNRDSLLNVLSGFVAIPTGLIVGASPSSSPLLFSAICREFSKPPEARTEDAQVMVSKVASRDCRTIRSAMRAIIANFIGTAVQFDDGEDDDERDVVTSSEYSRLPPEDMQNLLIWYQEQVRISQQRNCPCPTLVLLLEDLEAFEGRILCQMIETLSRYASKLPLVFLFGVATSPNALNHAVTRNITNLLEVTTIFVEPGYDVLNTLIKGLFIDWDPPLALGPKAFRYIWNSFSDMNHSIDSVVSSLQYLYMIHFMGKSYAVLNQDSSVDMKNLTKLPQSILREAQDGLMALKNVKSPTTPDQLELAQRLSGDRQSVLDEVDRQRLRRYLWQKRMRSAVDMLFLLQEYWHRPEPLESILCRLGEGTMVESVDGICKPIMQSDSSKLLGFLHQATQSANHGEKEKEDDISAKLQQAIKTAISQIETILAENGDKNRKPINCNIPGSEMMHSVITNNDRIFTKITQDVAASMASYFKTSLQPSSDLLLNEIWFTNDVHTLRRFHPSFLPSLLKILKKVDGSTEEGQLSKSAEDTYADVAVCHRLYRETGRSINLGDWWKAFEQATGETTLEGKGDVATNAEEIDDKSSDGESGNTSNGTRIKQARFLRAVGDLGYIGFCQVTSRKAEHVNKTVC